MSSNTNKLEIIINLIPNDPCGETVFNCKIVSEGVFDVQFYLMTNTINTEFTRDDNTKLLQNVACEKVKDILCSKSFNLFSNIDFSTNTVFREAKKYIDDYEHTKKFEIDLSNEYFNPIKEQAMHYQMIKDKFNKCITELKEHSEASPLVIKSELYKINSLIDNLKTIVYSGNIGVMENWYKEKIANIQGCFQELSKRKDQSNQTYQTYVSQINKALYSFSCPDTFHRKPIG